DLGADVLQLRARSRERPREVVDHADLDLLLLRLRRQGEAEARKQRERQTHYALGHIVLPETAPVWLFWLNASHGLPRRLSSANGPRPASGRRTSARSADRACRTTRRAARRRRRSGSRPTPARRRFSFGRGSPHRASRGSW